MKKTIVVIVVIMLIAIVGVLVYRNAASNEPKKEEPKLEANNEKEIDKVEETEGLYIVPTMRDNIYADSLWCATFQLVWNDMKNEVVKQDIVFDPQIEMVENLNKEEFTEKMISESYYYKKYGIKSLELKEEIEKGIKDKFDETSDILDDFDWSEEGVDDPNNQDIRRYFFYVMLRRSFEFVNEFDELESGKFGDKYNDIKYFGIDGDSENKIGEQIEVLYYNSQDDFAIILNTKQDDEVILYKNPKGNNFKDIYNNMLGEADKYAGNIKFDDIDELKVPNIKLNEKKEYIELAGKSFQTNDPDYPTAEIVKAIQTIQFELDKKGGEIKSEAAIDIKMESTAIGSDDLEPRYFYVDNTFAIFLREKGKDMPYFAGMITDITKFQ